MASTRVLITWTWFVLGLLVYCAPDLIDSKTAMKMKMVTFSPDSMDEAHHQEHHFSDEDFNYDSDKTSEAIFHQEVNHQTSDYDCNDDDGVGGIIDAGGGGNAPDFGGKVEIDFVDQIQSMLEHISDFIDKIMIKSKHSHESYQILDRKRHHPYQSAHQQQQQHHENYDNEIAMHSDCPTGGGGGTGGEPHEQPHDNHLNELIRPPPPPPLGHNEPIVEKRPINLSHALDLHREPQRLAQRHKHLSEKFSLKTKLIDHLQQHQQPSGDSKASAESKTNVAEPPVRSVEELPAHAGNSDHAHKNEIDQQLSSKSFHSPVMEDASGKGVPVSGVEVKTHRAFAAQADGPPTTSAVKGPVDENGVLSQYKYIEPLASVTARESFKKAADIARHLRPGRAETAPATSGDPPDEGSVVGLEAVAPEASSAAAAAASTSWDKEAKFLGFGQVTKSKVFDFGRVDSGDMQALVTCQFVDVEESSEAQNVTISDVKWAKFNTNSLHTFDGPTPPFECPRELLDCKLDSVTSDSSVTIHPRPPVQVYANGEAPGYSISLHRLDDKHKGAYRCSARRQSGAKDELVYRVVLVE